jgi:acetone carboxylase gamma subunit
MVERLEKSHMRSAGPPERALAAIQQKASWMDRTSLPMARKPIAKTVIAVPDEHTTKCLCGKLASILVLQTEVC